MHTLPGVDFVTEARIISIIEDESCFSSAAKILR